MESFLSLSRFQDNTRKNNFTKHRSPGVREFADEPATERGRYEYRAKQAVRPRPIMERPLFSAGGTVLWTLVSSAVFSVFRCYLFLIFQ